MKNHYTKPAMCEVDIRLSQMICTSGSTASGSNSAGFLTKEDEQNVW